MRVVLLLCVGIAASMCSAGVSAARPAGAGGDLVHRYLAGLALVSGEERDMRHCDQASTYGDCDTKISTLTSGALILMAGVQRIPASGLSRLGLRVKHNAFEMFHRYFLAGEAFRTGAYGQYVSQLRQAITQGAAAAKLIGVSNRFAALMILADCGTWQLALNLPGDNPCS